MEDLRRGLIGDPCLAPPLKLSVLRLRENLVWHHQWLIRPRGHALLALQRSYGIGWQLRLLLSQLGREQLRRARLQAA